jgi:hypothetical protein
MESVFTIHAFLGFEIQLLCYEQKRNLNVAYVERSPLDQEYALIKIQNRRKVAQQE